MKKNLLLLSAAFLLLFGACKNESKKISYKLEKLQFNLEAPLFEGPNTAQVPVEINLEKITGISGISPDAVKSAKLVSCQINAAQGKDFNTVSSLVLQLAADKAEMTEIALLNPVPQNSATLTPKPADKDLKAFFQQGSIIVLLDAALLADTEESLSFEGNLSFELEVNQ